MPSSRFAGSSPIAGDLRLVHHQPVEHQAAGDDLARERRRLLRACAAATASRRSARRPPAATSRRQRRVHTRRPRVDQIEVLAAVDHQRHLVGRAAASAARSTVGYATTTSSRSSHSASGSVKARMPVSPALERPVDQRPAAHRLRRQPHALPARPAQQIGGVRVERVEVDAANGGSRSAVAASRACSTTCTLLTAVRCARVPRFAGETTPSPGRPCRRGAGEPMGRRSRPGGESPPS